MNKIEKFAIDCGAFNLAANLYLPSEPVGRVGAAIICHGLGSRKDNHSDFACHLAERGFAALAIDLRGHGESGGKLDEGVLDDIRMAIRYLKSRPEIDGDRLALRGSSLGGLLAIHAGANFPALRAIVAICPASETALGRLYAENGLPETLDQWGLQARIDRESFVNFLQSHNIYDAIWRISPRPLLIIHAKGDESIPFTNSEELYAHAREPKGLLLLEGGSHTSAQHDDGVHRYVADWLTRVFAPC